MNHIYRTLWSVATQSWQAVPETAKTAGKKSKSSAGGVIASVALSFSLTGGAHAQAPPAIHQLPTGGSVVRGTATIQQTATAQAAAMTVNQTSQRAVVNWNTFNIGSAASVNFVQPNAQAVTLNRVNDSNPSQIFGRITSNGQVVLTNANGIYFAPGSSVDVGAITATTHSISDDNFMSGKYVFERNGATGKIINEGNITAALAGYVALLAPEVQNAGVVVARAGTVVMAAGETITLNIDGAGSLAGITTTPSAIATLIENKHAVQAPDGQIILSAVALNKLQAGVIKNSGSLEANSLVSKGGKIYLEGDDITLASTSKIEAKGASGGGTVLVGGDWQGSGEMRQATKVTMEAGATIDASATDKGDGGKVVLWSDVHNADSVTQVEGRIKAEAGPNGGDGGKVETSGHHLHVNDIQVSTQAKAGNTGEWLLDPVDFTIAASGGDMTGAALTALLTGNTDITIQSGTGTNTASSYFGSTGTEGNINVNDAVSWSKNKLTLAASNNIYINDVMAATGNASLALNFGLGAVASGNTNVIKTKIGPNDTFIGKVNLPAGTANFTTKQGSDGAVKAYTVITALGASNSSLTTTDLQGVNGNSSLSYVLGADINPTGSGWWNTGAGFKPLATTAAFTGVFDGLGHTISNLSFNLPTSNWVGFFSEISTGTVRNLGLRGVTSAGKYGVGSLAGQVSGNGLISNSFTTGSVNSPNGSYVGGFVGQLFRGTISESYSSASVTVTVITGNTETGGLVGWMKSGTITKSYASGNVTSSGGDVGGLIGLIEIPAAQFASFVLDNYALGNVSGLLNVGGLIGRISSNGGLSSSSQLTRNYSNNLVSGTSGSSSVAGVIGNGNAIFSRSENYWNTTTSGKSTGMGGSLTYSQTGFTGLTSAETLVKSNFAGFDFTSSSPVWTMPDGGGSPVLCTFQSSCGSVQLYLLPTSGQSNVYGSAPTSLSYCYSSSASSCVSVSYAGIPSANQTFTLTNGAVSKTESVSGSGITGTLALTGSPTISGTGLVATTNAGTYALTLTPTLTLAGYTFAAGNAVNYTINKAHLTVTANDASKTYGSANPALTASVSGFVNGQSLATSGVTGVGSATTTATNISGAGSEVITATAGSLAATNYDFTNLVNGTLTINKAHLTVTANDASKTYGSVNPNLTATVSGFVNSETLATSGVTGTGSATTTATNSTGAGAAVISAGTGNLAAANYDFTSLVDGTLTINKAHLTVSANNANKTYGSANPTLTTTVSGFVNSETLATSGVTGTGAATTTATTSTGAGTATITAATGSLTAANYDFTNFVDGMLTINKAHLTVTASNAAKTYGDANPTFSASVSGFVNGETLATSGVTGTGAATTTATTSTGAGTAVITAGTGNLAAANYDFTNLVNGMLTINKAHLTVTANDANKTYGSASPALTTSVSGFVNSETLTTSGVTGTGAATTTATTSTGVGTAVITSATGSLAAANYDFTNFVDGTLTINKANLSRVVAAKPYDGLNTVTAAQMTAIEGVNGETFIATVGTAAISNKNVFTPNKTLTDLSSLTLVGSSNTVLASNYNLNTGLPAAGNNNQVTISALDLQVTGVSAVNKVYDATRNAALTGVASVTGINGESVSATGTGVGLFANKNVDRAKPVTVTGFTLTGNDAGNYNVVQPVGVTADITPAPLTISGITAPNKVYDGGTSATVSTSNVVKTGLIGNDVVNVASTGSFVDKNAGTGKIVNLSSSYSGTDTGNYSIIDQATTTADINKAPLTVTAANAVKNLGDANPALSVALTGFVGGETLATSGVTGNGLATTTATVSTDAGTAAITASAGTLAASNYAFSNLVDGALTIRPISALNNTEVTTLIGAQLANLSGAQVGSFSASQLQVFSPQQLSALSPSQLAGMTTLQLLSLSPAQMAAISPAKIALMTTAELGALTDVQLQALSPTQLAAIAPANFSAFTPAQIMAMSIAQVQNLSPEQLATFSPAQIASLNAAELAYFDARQLAAIGIFPKVETPATVTAAVTPPIETKPISTPTPTPQTTASNTEVQEVADASDVSTDKKDKHSTFEAPIPVMTEVATANTSAAAAPEPLQAATPVQSAALSTRAVQALLFPPSAESSTRTGVLAITILNSTETRPTTAGIAFEQDADTVSLRFTSAPASVPPMSDKVVFSDKLVTFMVATHSGVMVEFEGSVVNNRMVIVAPSAAAKRVARSEISLVLAAAVTSLGKENRVILAKLDGVVLDLR